MFKSYLKTALRNLWRHKAFSLINIIGLAIGMTACLLIFLYINFELSYDRFHDKADRIYRLTTDVKTPTEVIHAGITSAPMGYNIKNDFPEVEQVTRINFTGFLVQKGNEKFQEDEMLFADSSFFSVFSFRLLKGDPSTVLRDPFSLVLSETAAKKYFGSSNAVGQALLLNGQYNAVITGIMKDMPANSCFRSDMLVSMTTLTQKLEPRKDEEWTNFGFYTFLVLPEKYDHVQLQSKFPAFMNNHVGEEMKKNNMYYTLFLQPLKDIYLGAKLDGSEVQTGSRSNIYVFSIIALFILIIACINFINLTTARSAERAKEVGIRKVIGAERKQLMGQFMGESALLSAVSFLLALLFAVLMLPYFNQLSGKIITESIFKESFPISLLFITALLVGLVAGVYPALILSGFHPVSILKGRIKGSKNGVTMRQVLVVSQFVISIILITGTITVYRQLNFMRSQQLGFNKDQMVVIDFHFDDQVQRKIETIKDELKKIPEVLSSSFSSSVPGKWNNQAFSEIENVSGEMQGANLHLYSIDYDFLPHYKMNVVAGRGFSKDLATDSTNAIIVNEAAVKAFGYSSAEEIVGRKVSQWGRNGTIIGVIKNFNFRSLQNPIMPLTLRIAPSDVGLLSVNIAASNIPSTINQLQKKWKELVPDRPFNYFFLDEAFNKQYQTEEKFGQLFLNFACLAIIISCLGLLGLASYSTIQRTREIGIRKVLGASVSGITSLLTRDFIKLVLVAILISTPIAWWAMHKWLQEFAYRMTISWQVFALAGVIAITIAVVTVSFQAIKAAIVNPVKSLKVE